MKRAPLMASWLAVFGSLLAVAILPGQDASLSAPQWSDLRDPPDELPVVQNAGRFDFPTELRDTPDIGYVLLRPMIDARGRVLAWGRSATLPNYERDLQVGQQRVRFSPAKRDGKGVNSEVTMALLFNPASANTDKPDATPRLLEVAAVRLPRPKGAKEDTDIPDQVVVVELAVDATGLVTAVKGIAPALQEEVTITMKNWRFAPARRGGQPVAATVRAPIIVMTEGGAPKKGPRVPPRPTSRAEPIYPVAMRVSGLRGEVLVDFKVDIEGRVQNPFVSRSLNPAFDDPAIEAVRKWKFEPGRIGDVPIVTRMQVPIIFTLNDTVDGGGNGMLTTKKGDLSKLPEALRYDTPPRLIGSVRPVYPHAQLVAGKEGRALVRFMVDEQGHVMQAVVAEASAPEFGQALLAAIELFTYEPALKGGRPNRAMLGFSQEFGRDERQQLVSYEDLRVLGREQKSPEKIAGAPDLDRKLVLVSQRAPRFPLSLLEKTSRGEAIVEFIVDEEGRARLPRAVSATEEAFGFAAVQAVASWRFEPPTRGGRATIVRVRAPIRFAVVEAAPVETKK